MHSRDNMQLSLPNMIFEDDYDVITERPTSKGVMAFYVNFDSENVTKKMPSKLQVKQASNLTKELLEARLDAAEQYRKVN